MHVYVNSDWNLLLDSKQLSPIPLKYFEHYLYVIRLKSCSLLVDRKKLKTEIIKREFIGMNGLQKREIYSYNRSEKFFDNEIALVIDA